ncbi:MAG: site-2 protease family protein [Candidatus Liptonbacteria bacterium]|nr:site-2 protease family protein [Candidatus Liptonbacteria bacterium]
MDFFIVFLLIVVFLAILILGHEGGHFLAARLFGVDVEEFGFGFPPRLFSKKIGKTIYSFNFFPFGGFVKIKGVDVSKEEADKIQKNDDLKNDFRSQSTLKKIIIILSGVIVNFIIGWLAFSVVFMVGIPKAVYVRGTLPESPAFLAGFQSGDKILGFEKMEDFIKLIEDSPQKNIEIEIKREGKVLFIEAVPRLDDNLNKGVLGIELFETGMEKSGLVNSFKNGFEQSVNIMKLIALSLASIIREGDFSSVVGPVGVFQAIGSAKELGIPYIFQLLGLISLNLVFINILPLPALDGGRVIFIIIEKIIRRPINYKIESAIHSFFFLVLLFLLIAVTIKDVSRLIF